MVFFCLYKRIDDQMHKPAPMAQRTAKKMVNSMALSVLVGYLKQMESCNKEKQSGNPA